MRNLMEKIAKVCPACFEAEYDYYADNDVVDVRLYDANMRIAKNTAKLIDVEGGVDKVSVEIPTSAEVNYAFSGYKFVRIEVTVKRSVPRSVGMHLFWNDAGRML